MTSLHKLVPELSINSPFWVELCAVRVFSFWFAIHVQKCSYFCFILCETFTFGIHLVLVADFQHSVVAPLLKYIINSDTRKVTKVSKLRATAIQ